MSNNYISLYTTSRTSAPTTEAPTQSTTQPDINYHTPIRLKINWFGKEQFTNYNIPVSNANLLTAYITYQTSSSTSIITKKAWNISGSTMSMDNILAKEGGYMFTYISADTSGNPVSNIIPESFYFDFAHFNNVNYINNTANSVVKNNTTYTAYSFNKYTTTYIDKDNILRYDSELEPAVAAMYNLTWDNPDCSAGGQYICSDILVQYQLSSRYVTGGEQIKSNYEELASKARNIVGTPYNYTNWPINIINDEYHTALPVTMNSSGKGILFYDTTNYRIYINGFNELYQLSKYNKSSNIDSSKSWIGPMRWMNSGYNGLDTKHRFIINENLPIFYNIKKINDISDSSDNSIFLFHTIIPTASKTSYLWSSLKQKVRFNLNLSIPTTEHNYYSTNAVMKTFSTGLFNPFDDNFRNNIIPSSFIYNSSKNNITNTYPIQLSVKDQNNKLNTILLQDYFNSQSAMAWPKSSLTLDFNYSNFDTKSSIYWNNSTLWPINYNLDGQDITAYAEIKSTPWWYFSSASVVNQASAFPSTMDNLWSGHINNTSPSLIPAVYTNSNNINDSYVNINLTYATNQIVGLAAQSTTTIWPIVNAKIPYVENKIIFRINGKDTSINSNELSQYIDYFDTSNKTYWSSSQNYGKVETDLLGSTLIPDNFKIINQTTNKYIQHISYLSKITKTGELISDNIVFRLKDAGNINTVQPEVGIWCNITYNHNSKNFGAYINNAYLYINNLNWDYDTAQPNTNNIIIDFKTVTKAPVRYTYYYFDNNIVNDGSSLTPNTFILSNSIYDRTEDVKHVLRYDYQNNVKILETPANSNNSYITIIPGVNTNINDIKNVFIFNESIGKAIIPISISGEVNGTTPPPLNIEFNQGNSIITLPNKLSDNNTITAYLNASVFNDNTDQYLINIGTGYNTTDLKILNQFISYYDTVGKSEAYINVHIDNSNEKLSILTNSNIFNNTPINIYTQFDNTKELSLNLSYINDNQINNTQTQIVKNNTFNVCSVFASVTPNTTSEPSNDIYFINGIDFNNKSLLHFNISAVENNNTINIDTVSVIPNNYELVNLVSSPNAYNGLDSIYNHWLIQNRFVNISGQIPFNDIRNEILKNVSLKYYKNIYAVEKYTDKIGIDVYFHNYIANPLDSSVYNYDYTNSYNGKNVSHYGFVKKLDLSDQLKDIKINNLYYRIYNRFDSVININNTPVAQNNYITIPVTTDINLIDIIKFNSSSYNSFIEALESTKKSLTSVINSIDITTTDKLKISIKEDWQANNSESKSGIRPITFNDIVKDETVRYSFNNNIIIGSIDLSDIVTITEKDTIYVNPVYLGITSEKLNIWEDTDKTTFNSEWTNLLNYINNITTYDLTSYDKIQITGFKLNTWKSENTSIVYRYGDQVGKTVDSNVTSADILGTQLKTKYNLYNTDNYLALTLQDINRFSNLPTDYEYIVNLANQTVILYYKLIKGNEEVENTIRFKITNNINYSQVSKSATLDANNIIDFDILYITDKNLNNIYNTEPGYLTFKSLSEDKHDKYKVTIGFCTDTETLPTTYSFIVADKDYNFGLKDYITTNKADETSVFYQKDISYIIIKQILIDPDDSKKEADKYYLNID